MLKIKNTKPQRLKKIEQIYMRLSEKDIQVYVLGRNEEAKNVIKGFEAINVKLSGVIDDYTEEKNYERISVIKSNLLSNNSIIISCVVEGRATTALEKMKRLEVSTSILTYFDLNLYKPDIFPKVRFTENNITDIDNNKEKYEWLYNVLFDSTSRETLSKLIDFRYNFDLEPMRYFSFRLDEQYFEPFIKFKNEEIFVDGGSFDGKTTQKFISLCSDYKEVYVFEPSPDSFEQTKQTLSGFKNINLFQNATYNKNAIFKFSASRGSANSFSEYGEVEVNTVCMDDLMSSATFIKLDVEGAEYETILGAERLIKKCTPKLAICVYHNQEDFWRIPQLILNINPKYKVFLRHYTEGLFETVMYFLQEGDIVSE